MINPSLSSYVFLQSRENWLLRERLLSGLWQLTFVALPFRIFRIINIDR